MTDQEYYDLIQPYNDARQLLLTRLEILSHTIYRKNESKPVHIMQSRIKKKSSIEEKLLLRGESLTKDNAKNLLQDIAGIRIVCYFIADLERLIQMLKNQSDLILIREKDYISVPKPNGYFGVCFFAKIERQEKKGLLCMLTFLFWRTRLKGEGKIPNLSSNFRTIYYLEYTKEPFCDKIKQVVTALKTF